MRQEFDAQWNQLAEEVMSGMREWRVQHPRATLAEIEAALDERMAQMRARLLTDLALASAAADLAASPPEERPRCGVCGGILHERGRHKRKLTTQGNQTVQHR